MEATLEKQAADPYVAHFESLEEARRTSEPTWLNALRKQALSRYAESGFPTIDHEDWRYTNVAPALKLPFRAAKLTGGDKAELSDLSSYPFASLKGPRLIFFNGRFQPQLSDLSGLPAGSVVAPLSQALQDHGELLESRLGRLVSGSENGFAALNLSLFSEGALVYLPPKSILKEPVQLIFLSESLKPGLHLYPRVFIAVEAQSEVTILESHLGLPGQSYVVNAVTEIAVGADARVEHCKYQDEVLSSYHLATLHMHLHSKSNFIAHSIAVGAKLSRNTIHTHLDGQGLEAVMNGLYLLRDDQLADHHMVVEHAQPHCNSHEYYNGILDGKSKGVFHGRILVRKDAQKTDAKQTNKNLLLSDDATVNTKPQLEIYADDVKCTHGATIGQIHPDSIFYLRARGIGIEQARRMLIHAFASEIIDRVWSEELRELLHDLVWDRLEANSLAQH